MMRNTSSNTRFRRVSRSASVIALVLSAALVTCWAVAVSARQANPAPAKTAKSVPSALSSTSGKTLAVTSKSATPPVKDKRDKAILVVADGVLDQKTNIGTGHNFIYTTGDTVITGDNARYDHNKSILDADGHLVMDDLEHHATGQKAHIEEDKKLAVLTGEIVLTLKPQTASPLNSADNETDNIEGAKKQGAVVTCDQVDSYYRRKFHILRGHLVFKQHIVQQGKPALDRTGTAEHAEYDAKKEVLVLFAPVHVEDSDGKTFDSEKDPVTITTKKGQETIVGKHLKIGFLVDTSAGEGDDDPGTPVKPDTAKPGDTPNPKNTTPPDAAHTDTTKDEKKAGKL